MNDLDPARIEIVLALYSIEDAHSLMMPGQSPTSTQEDILEAIATTRPLILKALEHLATAETLLEDRNSL